MFTGIVSDIGVVRAVEERADRRVTMGCSYDMASVAIGASIACSGVCLTVVEKGPDWFAVDVSGETRSRVAEGRFEPGARLNLERPLRVGDELGGHIVTGHVDGVGKVVAAEPVGGSLALTVAAPAELAPLIAAKGSVTVDGVSLTVNEVEAERFTLNIIPHTAAMTTLGALAVGAGVNLEVDVLARYLQRLQHSRM